MNWPFDGEYNTTFVFPEAKKDKKFSSLGKAAHAAARTKARQIGLQIDDAQSGKLGSSSITLRQQSRARAVKGKAMARMGIFVSAQTISIICLMDPMS